MSLVNLDFLPSVAGQSPHHPKEMSYFTDKVKLIKGELSASVVAEQGLEGKKALTSLLQFQPAMLPEVLQM